MSKSAPTHIDAAIGQRIKMRRAQLGITQEKLGAILNISFQQIQKYEAGTNRISVSRAAQIACALAVPASFFFLETEPGGSELEPTTAARDRQLRQLVTSFSRVTDPQQRDAIVAAVDAMVTRFDAERPAAGIETAVGPGYERGDPRADARK